MAHVLFVLPVMKLSGAERVVVDLARRLPKRGFETSIVCLEDDRTGFGDELRAEGIAVSGLRLSRRRLHACARALVKVLPSARPLIVNSHLFHANISARLAIRRLEPQQRAGVHVLSTVQVAERRFRPWHFWLDAWTARHARNEICVSRAVERFQREKTGLPAEFFRVIESGIDLDAFGPGRRDKVGATRVLSVGRLDPQKNYQMLLKAWAQVQSAIPHARLCIAGDGSEGERLRALSEKLELKHVEFPGFVKDVPALMRSADLYVQTSNWEGFGLTVAEAMATALPVIVTDADSLPELVTHGRTGVVVPKNDDAALSAAMLGMMNDGLRARELGDAARAEALKRFSAVRMADDYARLFESVLSEKPS
ncbi:MAG TPA: glycosyltransferase family 4 protein [Planctomycetota bacterium]|nr:glycosyltransferase family 4 protein [Planctomycetota bacterium]